MISLIPCYSLEDFSLYRKSSEVDEIFSAWSALYHPALVAHFGEAPRWEAAGSPSTGKDRKLIVVPPCAEYLVSRTWLKSAEAEGAVVIRHISDRDEILKVAFQKLGISPVPNIEWKSTFKPKSNNEEQLEVASSEISKEQPEELASDFEIPYDDGAESFLAVGLGCLLEELLTRKLRYMSNLDQVSFKTRIVDAALAHMTCQVEECEKNLQKAFDLLTTSKEYFFPTATKFLDLTWVHADDLAEALPQELQLRKRRSEKTNLILPVPLVKKCEAEFPETLELLRDEIHAKRVSLIGGDEWEGPLYLMNPLEIANVIQKGREIYLRVFGEAPRVFGRQEAGYAQILPQILKQSGYIGALARTGDGWTLLEKPTDRSRFIWTGRDGTKLAALCKKPLDATSSEDILQMPERIGNSYYSDDASAVVFEHRPGTESRWLHDIIRIDRYSPVLGKFYDINDYFRITEGAGEKEKFVKDRFKTNFLTRSAKRNRPDLVSDWVKRQRLEQIVSTFGKFEATLRMATLKTKRTEQLTCLFETYLERSKSLLQSVTETLSLLDERLFPVDAENSNVTLNLDAKFERFELEKEEILKAAAEYLSQAQGGVLKQNEVYENRLGYLLINASPTMKNVIWETRAFGNDSPSNPFQQLFEAAPDVKTRVFSDKNSRIVQYATSLPSGTVFWIPKLEEYEYRFLERPLFDKGSFPMQLLAAEEEQTRIVAESQNAEISASKKKKSSIFQRFASKLKVEVPNSASNDNNSEDVGPSIAEYVVKRYSATEIEKYYRLHNEHFEIRIDPTTGTVRRLTTSAANARFGNGMLRQPGLGNRLAFDFAFRLSKDQLKDDPRPKDDPHYGYTIAAADSIEIPTSGPSVGQIKTVGRMVAPNGELAGKFTQLLTIRLKSRLIEVDVEIDPIMAPDSAPWDSYYGCRFAWKDTLAEIRGGVAASLIGTMREYIQAPESVDIRSDENLGVTILSAGLPYFRKVDDARMDAILIPVGETKRKFRFAIGIDLNDPHASALSYLAPEPLRLENVPCPKRVSTSFVSIEETNVLVLEEQPILSSSKSIDRPNLTGIKLKLLETHSAKTTVTIRTYLPIDRVEFSDLTGVVKNETIELTNANSIALEIGPRQLKTLNLYFRSSSLK